MLATLVAATADSVSFALREGAARADADARAQEARRIADYQSRLLDTIDPAWVGAYAIGEIYKRGDAQIKSRFTDPEELKVQRLAFHRPMKTMDKSGVGAEVIIKSIIEPAEKEIEKDFADLPLVAAMLHHTVAGRYQLLGNLERAKANIEVAVRIRREQLGARHPDVASSVLLEAAIAWSLGGAARAEPLVRDAIAIREAALGVDAPESIEARQQLGGLLIARGASEEAVAVLGEALRAALARFGENDPRFFGLRREYAAALVGVGRAAEAEPLARSAMESFAKVIGENGAGPVRAQVTLGAAIAAQGRLDDAEKVLADIVQRTTRVYGPRTSTRSGRASRLRACECSAMVHQCRPRNSSR